MSNLDVNVNETVNVNNQKVNKTMNILERSKVARVQYEEGLKLINELDELNANIKKAEEILESHIASTQAINVEEVKEEIKKQEEYYKCLSEEIRFYETKENITDPPTVEDATVGDAALSSQMEALQEGLDEEVPTIVPIVVTEEEVLKLEEAYNEGPSEEDQKDFMEYFGVEYFFGNGDKMNKFHFNKLILSKLNTETDVHKKEYWVNSLTKEHAHMFNTKQLNRLEGMKIPF